MSYAYMYAVRDKVSGLYMISRHASFGPFEAMISSGVFFVDEAKAKKRIKEVRRSLDDRDPNRQIYTRYTVYTNDAFVGYFSTSPDFVAEGYECPYRPLELEVAKLYVGEVTEVK